MNIFIKTLLPLTLISLVLSGCSSSVNTWQAGKGASMASVYRQAMHQSNGATLTAVRRQLPRTVVVSNRQHLSATSYRNHFALLPNPIIHMHVYAHLAGEQQVPVPAYDTQFPFYQQVHYALPGEVAVR